MNAPAVYTAQSLHHARLRHGFFGRGKGTENASRAHAAQYLGVRAGKLVGLAQVHSARTVTVTAPWADSPPKADALVTQTPGLALCIRTADCVPVLLADTGAGVIGAAHAGWRGALAGILEATLAAMQKLGARAGHIRAAIGPCIAQQSYEVGPDFRQGFVTDDAQARRFFTPGSGDRWRFDLPGYCAMRLRRAGAMHVENLGMDTCARAGEFFSYRRACLRGEAEPGRNLSAILLQECDNGH